MSKTVDYLAAKVESLEKELEHFRRDIGREIRDLKEDLELLRKGAESLNKWVWYTTGFGAGAVFLSRFIEWWGKHFR